MGKERKHREHKNDKWERHEGEVCEVLYLLSCMCVLAFIGLKCMGSCFGEFPVSKRLSILLVLSKK